VAYGAYVAIKQLKGVTPKCFVVSSLEGNLKEIDTVPVRTLDGVSRDMLIVVAVSDLLQAQIHLRDYPNVFRLTSHEEHLLMSKYFGAKFPLASISSATPKPAFTLYETHSKNDKPLKNPPVLHPWEKRIRADDYPKNPQYCEMSAARRIWKSAASDWVGLEHYRRHLLVTPQMLTDDIDAVLPLPYICYPDTVSQFRRFVSGGVLNALLIALRKLHPDKYDGYIKILYGKLQYTYNLVAAKRSVYADYCIWFFGITEYMETMADKVPEIANTRALSYVAEVLTNLYFMSNKDKLKIRHAEKAIYTELPT
jgi:hypothetical protein